MRGIAVVLVLVCLVSSAFAACTNGKASADNTGCVCKSGYSASDCSSVRLSCTSKTLDKTEATWFPNLAVGTSDPATSPIRFVGNHLFARIDGNFVSDRSYDELTFVPSAAQAAAGTAVAAACHLGNTASFWTQGTDSTPCNDTFSLNMPWADHVSCGFANNTGKSDGDWMYITGYLYIRYIDSLGEVDGFNLTRSTKVPYSVSVRFQRHVTVQLQALNVTSDVKYGMALTEDIYDPVTQMLTLEITSIVNWPNMFYNGEALTIFKPDQVLPQIVGSISGALCTPNDCSATGNSLDSPREVFARNQAADDHSADYCSAVVEKSLCTQKFTLKAKLDQAHPLNCTYDGDYHITGELYTCREVASGSKPDCTHARINITFFIDQSNVCGVIGVAPTVTGHLYAFDPARTTNFATAVADKKYISNFELGKYAHFYASIASDDNTVGLHFREISFVEQGKSNWHTLFTSTGWTTDGTYAETYPARPAMEAGTSMFTDSKYFRVYFHSSIFKVNPNSQVIYTFRAVIDLSFQGNDHFVNPTEDRKRTIETTWEQAVTSAETNVFMRAPATGVAEKQQVQPVESGVSSVTFIASVVGAVAGTMIIVFVVVGFALRARSQSKDEPSSSLIAASAAAAEVANRA